MNRTIDHVTIDIGEGAYDYDADNWRRLPEVVNYAAAHGISVPDAIVRLVNDGLSHQGRLYLPEPREHAMLVPIGQNGS